MTVPPRTVHSSRLMNGTLTLGAAPGVDLSCQVQAVTIKMAYADDGDVKTMLCGDVLPSGRKKDGETLEGTLVQDFDIPESEGGVYDYVWNHELEKVAFTFTPNDSGVSYTGEVLLERPDQGGEAGGTLTADFVWVANGITKAFATTQTEGAA